MCIRDRAYADDIDLISRNENNLKNAFTALESSTKSIGLVINENKTKFIAVGSNNDNISIHGYSFERVKGFVYLGTNVDAEKLHKRNLKKNSGC